jgi:hypothetical protein
MTTTPTTPTTDAPDATTPAAVTTLANDFCPPGEPAEGWRLELLSGEVVPIAITIKHNYVSVDPIYEEGDEDVRRFRGLDRLLDTVTATAIVPAKTNGGPDIVTAQDSSVRWVLAELAKCFAGKGWRVTILAPGESSRAEALQRARELLALSERHREAWEACFHKTLLDPIFTAPAGEVSDAYLRVAGNRPAGHGPLTREARKELGPLWPGWQERAESAYAALAKVCTATDAEFIVPETAADAIVARVTELRAAAEKSERERLLNIAAQNDEMRRWADREKALIDAAFADLAEGKREPLRAALMHALTYAYEAADQTVMCPECSAAWWGVPEDIHENWHAPGCKLFAARVLVGESLDVTYPRTRLANDDPDGHDWKPSDPRPDTCTPAEKVRDVILDGWFARLARIGYADDAVPADVPPVVWMRAVHAVMDLLPRPQVGPYAKPAEKTDEKSADKPDEKVAVASVGLIPRDSEGRPL